jgi:hypothetical protein
VQVSSGSTPEGTDIVAVVVLIVGEPVTTTEVVGPCVVAIVVAAPVVRAGVGVPINSTRISRIQEL